ncbi:MAG: bifunctional DNA primase/polymerase [Candidatus Xenobiia bacterium LiM19]
MDSLQSSDFLEAVRSYIRRGFKVLPIPFRSKSPNIPDWPNLNVTLDNLENYFNSSPYNVGIILGARSNNLVDIDIDCIEARLLAPFFLPDTPLKSGRQSSPESHWWYCCVDITTRRFIDPEDSNSIAEIRADEHQTVVPPSTHPSGEHIVWYGESNVEPAQISVDVLIRAIEMIAAATLILKRWHQGSRNELVLRLSGMLAYGGMHLEEAERLLEAICQAGQDEEHHSRIDVLRRTYQRFQEGENITGIPSLRSILSQRVISKLCEWLHLRNSSNSRYTGQNSTNFSLSDLGNARRLVSYHGGNTRYSYHQGKFLIWNGQYWRKDGTAEIYRLAKDTVTSISFIK